MTKIKWEQDERKTYVFELSFYDENTEDYLDIELIREIDNEFNVVFYFNDWLLLFENKYGYCISALIYQKDKPYNVLVNIERY